MSNDKSNKLSLLHKYQSLLIENDRLKTENKILKAQLDALKYSEEKANETGQLIVAENDKGKINQDIPVRTKYTSSINQKSRSDEKLKFFMSLLMESIYYSNQISIRNLE